MTDRVREALRKHYPDRHDQADECLLGWLREVVRADDNVLDAGAGAGRFRHGLKKRAFVVGIDTNTAIRGNQELHFSHVASLGKMPLTNGSFDVVFCRAVLEHLADPPRIISEIARVLRPGGRFLFLTPNKYHYAMIAARLTPTAFHKWYMDRLGREAQHTFETFYQLNDRRRIREALEARGFMEERVRMIEGEPGYLTWSLPTFYLGMAYDRVVSSTESLAGLRATIVGQYVKL